MPEDGLAILGALLVCEVSQIEPVGVVLVRYVGSVLPDFQRQTANEVLLDLVPLVPKGATEGVGEVSQVGGEDLKAPHVLLGHSKLPGVLVSVSRI